MPWGETEHLYSEVTFLRGFIWGLLLPPPPFVLQVEQNRNWRLHRIPSRVSGSTYIDSRSILLRVELLGGRYALLPTTFDPGQCGAFLLRIYSEHRARLRCESTSPSFLPCTLQWPKFGLRICFHWQPPGLMQSM